MVRIAETTTTSMEAPDQTCTLLSADACELAIEDAMEMLAEIEVATDEEVKMVWADGSKVHRVMEERSSKAVAKEEKDRNRRLAVAEQEAQVKRKAQERIPLRRSANEGLAKKPAKASKPAAKSREHLTDTDTSEEDKGPKPST
jgi:hypothetical protein